MQFEKIVTFTVKYPLYFQNKEIAVEFGLMVLLFFTVFMSYLELVHNPTAALEKKYKDMKSQEFSDKYMRDTLETLSQFNAWQMLRYLIKTVGYMLLLILVHVIFVPAWLIYLYINQIGIHPLTIIAIVIYFLSNIDIFRGIIKAVRAKNYDPNKKVFTTKTPSYWARKIFFLLPKAYLAFVFILLILQPNGS